ncbi:MAG: hypothetical protein K5657_02990 [Desulfovibrio sp.]|nr:hypothetical protein [Desulfovibrio sp.]
MLPHYVVHAMEGRVRIRHHAFLAGGTARKAEQFLLRQSEVEALQPGYGSFLLLLKPEADLEALCKNLEENCPELQEKSSFSRRAVGIPIFSDLSPRRVEVRFLTAVSLLCILSSVIDSSKMHMVTGIVLAALTFRHIWVRRKAL